MTQWKISNIYVTLITHHHHRPLEIFSDVHIAYRRRARLRVASVLPGRYEVNVTLIRGKMLIVSKHCLIYPYLITVNICYYDIA
jgi:hypothetical protein